jgi:hypothetical protein
MRGNKIKTIDLALEKLSFQEDETSNSYIFSSENRPGSYREGYGRPATDRTEVRGRKFLKVTMRAKQEVERKLAAKVEEMPESSSSILDAVDGLCSCV